MGVKWEIGIAYFLPGKCEFHVDDSCVLHMYYFICVYLLCFVQLYTDVVSVYQFINITGSFCDHVPEPFWHFVYILVLIYMLVSTLSRY